MEVPVPSNLKALRYKAIGSPSFQRYHHFFKSRSQIVASEQLGAAAGMVPVACTMHVPMAGSAGSAGSRWRYVVGSVGSEMCKR